MREILSEKGHLKITVDFGCHVPTEDRSIKKVIYISSIRKNYLRWDLIEHSLGYQSNILPLSHSEPACKPNKAFFELEQM